MSGVAQGAAVVRFAMMSVFDHIPAHCPLCQSRVRGVTLCEGCLADLDARERQASPPRCRRCGLRADVQARCCSGCRDLDAPWACVVIAMPYERPYSTLISRFKHSRQLWLGTCLAGLMWRCRPDGWVPDRIVPIPSSRAALRQRGFNPAGELARGLGRVWHRPVSATGLARTRDGPKQSELGHLQRQIEAVDLFCATRSLSGERVVLVDDVMTTGATVNAAACALLDAGAREVIVMAAARTQRL